MGQSGECESAESAEIPEVYTVESSRCRVARRFCWACVCSSTVIIMCVQDQNRLFPGARLRKYDTDMVKYCNTSTVVRGIFNASVEFGGRTVTLPLYVMQSGKDPLLGREWL